MYYEYELCKCIYTFASNNQFHSEKMYVSYNKSDTQILSKLRAFIHRELLMNNSILEIMYELYYVSVIDQYLV